MRNTYTRLGLTLGAVLLTGGLTACGSESDSDGDTNGSGDKDSSADAGSEGTEGSDGSDDSEDNGIAGESGNDVAAKAAEEIKGAESLKVDLRMREATGEVAISLAVDQADNCAGTIGMAQGKAEIVKRGEKVWMKPDEAFWKAQGGAGGAAAHQLINGRWLAGTTADEMMSGMAGTCDLSKISSDTGDSEAEGWSDPKPATTDGQEVVVIERTKGGTKTALHIATKGKPYPLQAVKSGKETGTIKYTDYGKPVPAKAPSAQESLNVAELEKLGQ